MRKGVKNKCIYPIKRYGISSLKMTTNVPIDLNKSNTIKNNKYYLNIYNPSKIAPGMNNTYNIKSKLFLNFILDADEDVFFKKLIAD